MSAPEADPGEPVPEEVMRRVAREEARAVYDEYTVTDDDGKQWTFPEVVDAIAEIEGGTTRRTFAKAAVAMAYIAAGGVGYTAIMQAASEPAAADAFGESGTQADPLTKLWSHAIGAGDGAAAIGVDSPLALNHTAISSSTTVQDANVIEYDPSVAGFTITLGSDLEQRGLPVILQETGGSANAVTVDTQSGNGVDGGASITLQHANARTVLVFEGGEWRTNWFTERVDAREIVTDALTINEVVNSPPVDKTISSDSIDVSDATWVQLDGEGSSEDDLQTMTGAVNGQLVILQRVTNTITVVDSTDTDGFRLAGSTNKTLDNGFDSLMVQYWDGLSAWRQIAPLVER